MNAVLSMLRLVYPPVSSYEADALAVDPRVVESLRASDFYVMAMRSEVIFDYKNIERRDDVWTVPVLGETADGLSISDKVTLDIEKIAIAALGYLPETYTAEAGPKLLRFLPGGRSVVNDSDVEPFGWYTTEKLLHDRGRGAAGISGLSEHRRLATYELLYVGIAKRTDTFERLFKGGHSTRQKILSGEWPRRAGARVTDELILFPFRVYPTTFRTIGAQDVLTDVSQDDWGDYEKRVVADAEKAFVHLLDPQYNIEKFSRYPEGSDGLYGGDHQRYGYVVAENVTFATANVTMRGSLDPKTGIFDDSADAIFVTGDEVNLVSWA